MNHDPLHGSIDQQFDDVLFDRLADGELAGDEYRRLLASLDDRPDGWKRCALALLEGQALGGELRSLARENGECALERTQPAAHGRRVALPAVVLSVAASFLLAFGLGVWLRGGVSTSGVEPSFSGNVPKDASANRHVVVDGQQLPSASAVLPRGRMTLVVDDGAGRGEEIQLPVYDESEVDAALLGQRELPRDLVESLQHSGFELRRQRQVVPFDVDGRRVLVPMEQVEIVPVSTTYQ